MVDRFSRVAAARKDDDDDDDGRCPTRRRRKRLLEVRRRIIDSRNTSFSEEIYGEKNRGRSVPSARKSRTPPLPP